jgi:hypothetical protein
MADELAFKVVRINATYEALSRCVNLIIARGPDDEILLCHWVRVIEKPLPSLASWPRQGGRRGGRPAGRSFAPLVLRGDC